MKTTIMKKAAACIMTAALAFTALGAFAPAAQAAQEESTVSLPTPVVDAYTVHADAIYTNTPISRVNLHFATNGGTAIPDMQIIAGTKVLVSDGITQRQGFSFGGWYLDEALTQPVSTFAITADTTVYAKWIANSSTISPAPVTPVSTDSLSQTISADIFRQQAARMQARLALG